MPISYKSCRCGAKIPRNLKCCEKCEAERNKDYNHNRRDHTLQSFYNSKQWKAVRLIALQANPFCVVCGRPAQIADHIIELRDGGEPLSLENIQCMCSPCHNRKSAKEAAKRR